MKDRFLEFSKCSVFICNEVPQYGCVLHSDENGMMKKGRYLQWEYEAGNAASHLSSIVGLRKRYLLWIEATHCCCTY